MTSPNLKEKELRKNKNREFQDRLLWALNDLKNDAERYDHGEYSAINRSSVTLRTIFYGSGNILKQLRITGKIKIPTFTPFFTEHDCVSYGALDFVRLPKYFKNSDYFDTMLFSLRNETEPIQKLKIKRWLKQPIFRYDFVDLSRENLIRIEANQDGGAHVDPQINKFYRNLRDGDSSFKILTNGMDQQIFKNIIGGNNNKEMVFPQYINWGLTRQIVHETLLAFNNEFNLNYMPDLMSNFNKRLNKIIFKFSASSPNLYEGNNKE